LRNAAHQVKLRHRLMRDTFLGFLWFSRPGQQPVRETFGDSDALCGIGVMRGFRQDLVADEAVQVSPSAAPKHQAGEAVGSSVHGQAERFRVDDQGSVGNYRLRP